MKRFALILFLNLLFLDYVYPQVAEKAYKKYAKCIDQNNTDKAKKFIGKGLSIDARDVDGKTPFLYSLQQNKPDFARLFIDAGTNMNLTDYKGNTCLHYAIENCKQDSIVYDLIENGVSFRVTNNEGYSPFHFSILFSCPDLAFHLIEKGADFYLVTGLNENSLHLSIESGCDTLSYFLLKHDIDIRQPNNRGNTPLLTAMDFRQHDIAIRLIEMGADIHVWNNDSLNALFFAVFNQDVEIVKLLLEKGTSIKRPKNQETLLNISAARENAEIVRLLLVHGADYSGDCDDDDQCFNTAFIQYVNAGIVDDSARNDYFERSLGTYKNARAKYKNELTGVQAANTGKFFLEAITLAAGAYTGDYTYWGFDYEEEKRYYLKEQITKCEIKIREIEAILNPTATLPATITEESHPEEPVSDTLNTE